MPSNTNAPPTTAGCHAPPCDSLIVKHEPVLNLHPGERYEPQDIDSYLAQCTLNVPGLRLASDTVTAASLGKSDETNRVDAYLQFTEPACWLKPWPNTASAWTRYQAMTLRQRAYYAREFDRRGYRVLQYSFFYAMNDWRWHGGYNDHEADWETVSLFLEPADGGQWRPAYAAFTSHHERGDFVRHRWSTLQTEGDHPVLYIAVGSHASFRTAGTHPGSGETWVTRTQNLLRLFDRTAEGGRTIGPGGEPWQQRNVFDEACLPSWVQWEGLWGRPSWLRGFSGSTGLRERDNGLVWDDPGQWAEVPAPSAD